MTKLPDSCKDCAEYGSKFCTDCLEDIAKEFPETERVVLSTALKNIAKGLMRNE